MIQVRIGRLPNGKVPIADVRDGTTRSVLMRMVENQVSTGERTKTLERAVSELQGKPGGVARPVDDPEHWARKAKEHADRAEVAKGDAVAAKESAVSAKDDAVAAKNAAVEAKEAAEEAARTISGSVKVKEFAMTVNVAAGSAAAYSAYVYPDDDIGTGHVPVLAVCSYSGNQKLCATRCDLSNLSGRWSVAITVSNMDSASHSGNAKVRVLYAPAP